MTATTTTAEAEGFLAAVRAELDDLPDEERAELLEDLALHLAELSAPGDDGEEDVPLHVRLGPPGEYAAELRAAAGLPPRAPLPSSAAAPRARLRHLMARSSLARVIARGWRHPSTVAVVALLGELRPAWWVVRGYLVVAVPSLWSPNGTDDFPLPRVLGSGALGGVLVVGAVVASVALGRRPLPTPARLLVRGLDVTLVLCLLALFAQADARVSRLARSAPAVSAGDPDYRLQSRYGPITNIFPFSKDGSPLDDVLLFDQDGRPLHVEPQQWWPDRCQRVPAPPLAADNIPVEWVYPQRYVVAGNPPGSRCQDVSRPDVSLPVFGDVGGVTGDAGQIGADTSSPDEQPGGPSSMGATVSPSTGTTVPAPTSPEAG